MSRKRTIAVIGRGTLSRDDPLYQTAFEIGKAVIDHGFRLITGGLGGVMEAASKGARSSKRWRDGDIIGILPGGSAEDANQYVDVPIPTGLGIARNTMVTNADGIIAVGGGAGTLSEIAFSWQKGKPIVSLRVPGWSGELSDRAVDDRHPERIIRGVDGAEEAVKELSRSMRD